ncbi:MAG: HAD family hydrolase [Pirellulales bacterium]
MNACHVCLFDIDGTLIHSGGAGKAAFDATLAEEFGIGEVDGTVEFAGRTDRAIVNDLFRSHAIDPTEANWRRFTRLYLVRLRDTLPACAGHVLPGIGELVERLSGRSDTCLGLLTGNVAEGAELKLAHYDLDRYFSFGGFGDRHVDRAAVASEAVAAARDHVGASVLKRVVVVGDTPHDVRCGRSIGARVLAVATGLFTADELAHEAPDVVVEDLSDPGPLLELIGP